MKKLKIAMLCSNFIRIPPLPKFVPSGYSGAPEGVASQITEEMVKRGHDVTMFASGNSETSAKLVSVTERDSATDKKIGIRNHYHYEHLLISKAYRMAKDGKFDIIHSHFDMRSAYYAPLVETPTVSTLHSPLESAVIKAVLEPFQNTQYYVSISNAQRKPLPKLRYAATIYHGLDLGKIKFSPGKKEELVFVGRLVENKGVYEAIRAAQITGNRLFLLGSSPMDEYWRAKIEPNLDDKIKNPGFIKHGEVLKHLQKAKALIFPIQWEEPFGLVMIEAMACGTPVIAFDRGSVSEIVEDGKTGFVVPSLDKKGKPNINGLVEAIKNIGTIDRAECRRHAEEKFSVKKMIDGYEEVYYNIINQKR